MSKYRMAAFLFIGLFIALGCAGGKAVEVQLTLDGKPLEGAAVVLLGDTGGPPINGATDSGGNASLRGPRGEGVKPGTYKVVVTKTAAISSGPVDVKSSDYKAMMMKTSKGGGGKSEVPIIYSKPDTTPLSITVPSATGPIKLEMKSKP